MGSFNTTGFLSGIPIRYNDEVVCFLGKRNTGSLELGSPFAVVSPVYLPFYGRYNDYGYIKDVKPSKTVEILERISGVSVEEFCKGVERCIYGDTLGENLEYWAKYGDGEEEIYKPLRAVYGKYSLPILLFEHLEYYNKLFDYKPDLILRADKEPIFDLFYKLISKTVEIIDLLKSKGKLEDYVDCINVPKIFSGIDTTMTNYFTWRKGDVGEECSKLQEEIKGIHNPAFPNYCDSPEAFQMDEFLEMGDILELFQAEKEEVKKVFNMITSLRSIPMCIGFSKTAGEQNYNFQVLKKFYDTGAAILDEKIKEDEGDEEEDEEED